MGIQGLMSFCLQRKDQCVDYTDLVELARQQNGIEILVDFYSFSHLLANSFWKSLSGITGNPYLRLLGGEYKTYHKYVTKLLKDLQSVGIKLVMIIDGAKGSSKIGTEQKLETWKFRHRKDLDKLRDLLGVCRGDKQIEDFPVEHGVRPVVIEEQLRLAMNECNCEVIQCITGEADYFIAKLLQERPQAVAVLSNDSDFCVFKNCVFIPNDLFDLNNDLQLATGQPFPDKPIRLTVGMISADKVISALGLQDESQLVEISILAGNDLTKPYLHNDLYYKLGMKGRRSLTQCAEWVKMHGTFEGHPAAHKAMAQNLRLAEAVSRSRKFYDLQLPPEEVEIRGEQTSILVEGMKTGKYPANFMGMHNGFYWHRMLLEEVENGHPCAEVALSELRSYVYRMVLERRDNRVTEYGRTSWADLQIAGVYAPRDRFVPCVNFIHPEQVFKNLRTFHHIMTHQEPGFHIKYFERYGRKNGFICYVLRYFLVMNTKANLYLTYDEFLVAMSCVFGEYKYDEAWYQGSRLKPTTRCVTVHNWLQDVYRHAYCMLGKLLQLTHEFPTPAEIFSGSVFTAFYMLTHHTDTLYHIGFPQPAMHRIRTDMDSTIYEKRHMLRYLVEGIFEYNSRF